MRSRPRTVMRSGAPGPAPMKCTVMRPSSSESAMAQVAPSAARRGPSSRPPAPAPASAAASATWATPKRACAACGGREDPRRPPPASASSGSGDQRRADEPRGLDEPRLVRLGGEGEEPPLALGRRRHAASARRAARRSPRPRRPPGSRRRWRRTGSWLRPPPLHDRHGGAPAGESARPARRARRRSARARRPAARASSTQAACVSSVTALTTSRPPGGSASTRALDHAGRRSRRRR